MKYSQERKQAVLTKPAPPHRRTIKDVAAEEGIAEATLCHVADTDRRLGGTPLDEAAVIKSRRGPQL